MKLLLLSDIHLAVDNPIARLDNMVETQWDKLRYIFDYAEKNEIEYILQAGDFTHTKRSWSLLEKLSNYLMTKRTVVEIMLVKGQHDSFYHQMGNHRTTTGVLISSGIVTLLDSKPINIGDEINIYGCSYGEEIPEILNKSFFNILVIHAPIGDKPYGNFEYSDAKRFLKKHKQYDLILCGDVHEKFIIEDKNRIICNTGVMLRHEASKQMMEHKPCFFVYHIDTNKIKEIIIPALPSDQVLSRDHLERKKERESNFEDFINNIQKMKGNHSISFDDNLKRVIKTNKTVNAVKSIIDRYLQEGRSDL